MPADHELISIMGLNPPDSAGLDNVTNNNNKKPKDESSQRRRQQLDTMGNFLSTNWFQNQTKKRQEYHDTLRKSQQRYVEGITTL